MSNSKSRTIQGVWEKFNLTIGFITVTDFKYDELGNLRLNSFEISRYLAEFKTSSRKS